MFRESSKMEYKNYITITKNLTNLIINQDPIYRVNSAEVSKLKNQMKAQKEVGWKKPRKESIAAFLGTV